MPAALRRRTVVAITGKCAAPDVITQQDLEELQNCQRMMFTTSKMAANSSSSIMRRIEDGATVQEGRLAFDEHFEMAVTDDVLDVFEPSGADDEKTLDVPRSLLRVALKQAWLKSPEMQNFGGDSGKAGARKRKK